MPAHEKRGQSKDGDLAHCEGRNGGGATMVSCASGGRAVASGGERDASKCELSPGPAQREGGAVELVGDGEAKGENRGGCARLSGRGKVTAVVENRSWEGAFL
jgi:hypothetical protein